MILTTKLLDYLNRVFNKDPQEFLALRVTSDSGALTWSVADTVLTLLPVGGSAQALSINLADYTVQSLANFIAAQPGYVVPYVDSTALQDLSALVLLEGTGDVNTSNGDHLNGYTSLLWAWINAVASELELAQAQIVNAIAQMDTNSAQGQWLDLLGSYYDVPRNPSELDPPYSQRIIASVLLPSSNNIGMAIALESRFPGGQAIITDALTNTASLVIRDGSIKFNSLFTHNSNVLGIANGFFDVTFAFDFGGPITPLQYVTLLIAAVNSYRAGGTYIRNLVIKNGMSATVITSSFNVGPILVIVYDQYETIEDAWDWFSEEVEDQGYMQMLLESSAIVGDSEGLQLQDEYPWEVQQVDQDELTFEFSDGPPIANASTMPVEDMFDWSAEAPDEDDRISAIDSAPVGADGAPNPVEDAFDWNTQETDQDERVDAFDSSVVTDDAVQNQNFEDYSDLTQDDAEEIIVDEYLNESASDLPSADPWQWADDEIEGHLAESDDYLNIDAPVTGTIQTESGQTLETESSVPLSTET